jgi:DNA repair protein RadD
MKHALRPHQARAMDMLRQSLGSGHRRPMLGLATGSGKTIIGAAIVEGARAKGNRVVFTAPAVDLIDQTVRAFEAEGLKGIGVIQADHPRTDPSMPIQIASVQTLARRSLPDTDLVIVDEAHEGHRIISEWMKQRPDLRFVGLSATPWARGLGKHYDDLVTPAAMPQLISAGFLSGFKVFAPSKPDLSGIRIMAGDYEVDQLAAAMLRRELDRTVISAWRRYAEGLPTLAYGVNRAHALWLQDGFLRAGIPAAYVDGDTPKRERQAIRAAYHEGRIKVVASVGTMTRGVDWDVRCILLDRPTKSEILYTQIFGRGMRPAEGKDALIAIDLTGTTEELGFVTDLGLGQLNAGEQLMSSRKVAAPEPCPNCCLLNRPGMKVCPNCGRTVPEPTPQQRLEALTASLRLPKARGRQRLWSGLQWWAQQYHLSEKWCLANYHAVFGNWPTGLRSAPEAPDHEVRGWISTSRQVWAARRDAIRENGEVGAPF